MLFSLLLPALAARSEISHEVLIDQLELRGQNGPDAIHWEQGAWLGDHVHRVSFDTSGDLRTQGSVGGEAELQLSVGRLPTPAFELRAGVRHDRFWGPGPDLDRTFAAVDAVIAAPFAIELAPAVFLSDDGDFSARLTSVADVPLAERLIAQPRFEVNVAAHDVPRFGVERGFNDIELGLRVRYETPGGIAPYLGVSWIQALGNTADLTREGGDDAHTLSLVAGLRFAF